MSTDLSIRPMTEDDLQLALEWARAEGWNPGLDDAAPFFAADPAGYFMGRIGARPVGCISVVRYGGSFAFLGLYIVHPDFRGRGHGKAIWDTGMASASGRTIGLDGVPAQQQNYGRSGFATAYRTMRFGGVVSNVAGRTTARLCNADDIGALIAYDAAIFPQPRSAFLTAWCTAGDTRRTFVVKHGGAIRGYGTIRRCHEGFKIGPFYADDGRAAADLLAALAGEAGQAPVWIDVPEDNAAGTQLARANGLEPVFETARMYHGPAPAMPLHRVFGASTLELG